MQVVTDFLYACVAIIFNVFLLKQKVQYKKKTKTKFDSIPKLKRSFSILLKKDIRENTFSYLNSSFTLKKK